MASLPTLRLATIVQVSVAGSYLNDDTMVTITVIDDIQGSYLQLNASFQYESENIPFHAVEPRLLRIGDGRCVVASDGVKEPVHHPHLTPGAK